MSKGPGLTFTLVLLAIVFLTPSCSFRQIVEPMPLYERAMPSAGVAVTAGAGATSGLVYSGTSWHDTAWVYRTEYATDRYLGGNALLRVGYAVPWVSMFGLASVSPSGWLEHSERTRIAIPGTPFIPWEYALGIKVQTWQGGAFRLSTGGGTGKGIELENNRLDFHVMQDFGRWVTASAGGGFRGWQLGATCHVPLGARVTGHIAASLLAFDPGTLRTGFPVHTAPIAASLGFACEFLPRPNHGPDNTAWFLPDRLSAVR